MPALATLCWQSRGADRFAGRVIEQTIGEKLPAGFQRSEFQYEHGFVDKVVPRTEMRETLAQLLRLHA